MTNETKDPSVAKTGRGTTETQSANERAGAWSTSAKIKENLQG